MPHDNFEQHNKGSAQGPDGMLDMRDMCWSKAAPAACVRSRLPVTVPSMRPSELEHGAHSLTRQAGVLRVLSCRQKRARFPDYTILRPSVPSKEIVKGRRGWGVPNSISI